jgi:hypothetical protein
MFGRNLRIKPDWVKLKLLIMTLYGLKYLKFEYYYIYICR